MAAVSERESVTGAITLREGSHWADYRNPAPMPSCAAFGAGSPPCEDVSGSPTDPVPAFMTLPVPPLYLGEGDTRFFINRCSGSKFTRKPNQNRQRPSNPNAKILAPVKA
jgi:hypothetical protein